MHNMCYKCAQYTSVLMSVNVLKHNFQVLETVLQVWQLIHIRCLELSRSKTSSNYFPSVQWRLYL